MTESARDGGGAETSNFSVERRCSFSSRVEWSVSLSSKKTAEWSSFFDVGECSCRQVTRCSSEGGAGSPVWLRPPLEDEPPVSQTSAPPQLPDSHGHSHHSLCRLLLYPRGDAQALPGYFSVYLHLESVKGTSSGGLRSFASYKLSLLNRDPSKTIVKDSWHRFR